MNVQDLRREERAMTQVESPRLSLCIDDATGRILELRDRQFDRHMLIWRPVLLAQANMQEAGGFGPFGALFAGAQWKARTAGETYILTAELANGCRWRQQLRLDDACMRIDLRLSNPSPGTVAEELRVALSVQPGYGGDWPRMITACLNNQQKVTVADRRGSRQEVYPITIENVTRGFGDAAWASVTDRTSGLGLWAELPAGAVTLLTSKAFDFTWSAPVLLEPGGSRGWTFRLATFQNMDNPERFAGGWLAGSKGNRLAARAEDACEPVRVRLFGQKDTPAALQLDRWQPECVVSQEFAAIRRRLEQLRDQAGSDARRRAVLTSFLHRARMLEIRRPVAQLEVLRDLLAEAEHVAAAPQAYRSFYSQADRQNMRRLAEPFDVPAATIDLRAKLAEPFAIDQPRLRFYDPSRIPSAHAGQVHQAACLAAVAGDAELAKLAARRLVDVFADAWGRFGILMHETIHHGVLLTSLAPAYSLIADLGALDDDPEGEARVVAMLWDTADQIHQLRRPHQSVSNWQGMEQAGITAVAAVLPGHPQTAARVEYALSQLENLLTKGVFPEGLFWEMSLGYHQNVQQFLMANAEHLLRCGVDAMSHPIGGRSILELARRTAGMLMPNGKVPRFEDSSYGVDARLLAHYARRFRDRPLMAAARLAGYKPGPGDLHWPAEPIEAEPAPPLPRLKVFADGQAILRNGRVGLALDFGPHGGWHGDWDKLSFEMMDAQGVLVCDPGTFRYEEAIHWSHFKHTISHSTVTLEDRRQLTCSGWLIEQSGELGREAVTVAAATYPNVTHRRTVRLVEAGFAIEDALEGEFDAAEAVFRLTLPDRPEVAGNVVYLPRLRIELCSPADPDRVEIAEVPIMPTTGVDKSRPYETGYQLRWHRRISAGQSSIGFACLLLAGSGEE